MDSKTIALLNQLNQQFYQTVANSFDETRSRAWAGWEQLVEYLPKTPAEKFKVLDIGCGNGRFGVFLSEHISNLFYMGIDSNLFLLQRAHETLTEHAVEHHLQQANILDKFAPEHLPYDLVVAFGVMHHIPGFEQRRAFVHKMAGWLSGTGILALTFWTFYEQERFRERIVAWDDPQVPEIYRHLPVEKHDYLLDWRREAKALRYCHYVDLEEQRQLTDGFNVIATYDADGSNRYVILSSG